MAPPLMRYLRRFSISASVSVKLRLPVKYMKGGFFSKISWEERLRGVAMTSATMLPRESWLTMFMRLGMGPAKILPSRISRMSSSCGYQPAPPSSYLAT